MRNRLMDGLPFNKSQLQASYFFIMCVLIEGEVEIENGFFKKLGEIYFLPAFTVFYLY